MSYADGLLPESQGGSPLERLRAESEELRKESERLAAEQGREAELAEWEAEFKAQQKAREKRSRRLRLVRGEPLEVHMWKRKQTLADMGFPDARAEAQRWRPTAMKMLAASRRAWQGGTVALLALGRFADAAASAHRLQLERDQRAAILSQ